MMNSNIVDQVNINVSELLDFSKVANAPEKYPTFEAHLTNEDKTENTNKTALLHINIAQEKNSPTQLDAALKIVGAEFKTVTIYLDMQLALLAYSIILPYMPKEQLQKILERKKIDWITQNLTVINAGTTAWSIIPDTEQSIQQAKDENILKLNKLLKLDSFFNEKIKADARTLKEYLFTTHDITDAMYDQDIQKNNSAIDQYLIARIAAIAAMYSFDHISYAYITPTKMRSYTHLQKTSVMEHLPSCLSLSFTKTTTNDSEQILTSTEINQNLHEYNLLGKISKHKSYLENAAKHFPGNAYIESLDNTFISCNDQQAIAFGMNDKSYIEGKALDELLSKTESDAIAEVIVAATTTNKTQVLLEDIVHLGEQQTLLSIKMPLRNKKDKIIGVIGFSTQIKEKAEIEKLKKLESDTGSAGLMQAIAASNVTVENNPYDTSYMKSMIENMPGLVFWQDTNGQILGCNQNQADFLGLEKDAEIIGKYPKDFLTAEQAKEALRDLAEITKTGEPIIKEELYKSGDEIVAMISHKTAIKGSNDNVIGIMVVALDLTAENQQKIKLEQEKDRLEIAHNFKNQFIQDLEHDMRTPFVGLCSMTELCASKENDFAKKQQLLEISNYAKDLLAYCDSLLEFSRNESFKNNNKLISLQDLIVSIVNTHITTLKAKGLEFDLDYDSNLPSSIMGDSYKLKRIISNLMSNAIKYTDQGYIKMAVRLESSKEIDHNNVATIAFVILARDINKEQSLEHQNKTPKYKKEPGLIEATRFVEDLKGEICINPTNDANEENEITVKLTFEVPLNKEAESFVPHNSLNKKILISEDSRINIKFLEAIITEIGCTSKSASTGKDTLSILDDEHFDILLLDVGLADTDGYTLAHKVRELELKKKRNPIKIIMMTAQQSRINQGLDKELNITDNFIKPVTIKDLITTITKCTLDKEEATT